MSSATIRPRRVVIMGAAGRDFHTFNTVFREDPTAEVVAFTAAQIHGIAGRRYPPSLAGPRYPDGIPIVPEAELETLIRERAVDEVVFAYSDVEHLHVMHRASAVLAAGADFTLIGPRRSMLVSRLPVISICAVRTGAGKSQTARWLARLLRRKGLRTAVIRHPMPYGDLEKQTAQRFASLADIDAADCTIEEREEYEPHIAVGATIHAGVDYAEVLRQAESDADLIIWEGGNNDFSFIAPALQIVLVDPLRPGHETTHHPGEAVLRMADIVLVAKCGSAREADIEQSFATARALAPRATVVRADSRIELDDPAAVAGARVLVVDDGPTITHGGMAYGAGWLAATRAGAAEIVDPRASAVGRIAETYAAWPHIGQVLPAMGYGAQDLADLAATINGADADVVVSGTPSDIARLTPLNKPVVRARYEFEDIGDPPLADLVEGFLRARGLA